jgi:hypothetical protein
MCIAGMLAGMSMFLSVGGIGPIVGDGMPVEVGGPICIGGIAIELSWRLQS